MNEEELLKISTEVINASDIALVGTIGLKGYPNIRALKKMKNDGIKTFYFSTRIDSTKVKEMKKNKKGSIYFYDRSTYVGIMIEGTFRVESNTTVGVAELYELDPHDPYEFCTVIFESKYVHIYKNYKTTRIEIK